MIPRGRLKQSGTLDLYSREFYDGEDKNSIYLFCVLKSSKLIDNYYITFIFDDYDYNYENNSDYFNHDYSNDDYIHTSEMLNSTNDNKINYEHTKNQRIILIF